MTPGKNRPTNTLFSIMTYKEIVLRLLKTRGDIVCLEQHLMSDFKEVNGNGENFSQWCERNDIEFLKLPSEEPAKLRLRRKEFNFEEN